MNRENTNVRSRGSTSKVWAARSITKTDIERAYLLNDGWQRRRIEAFGAVNRETLRALGARIVRRKKRA